MSYLEAYLYSDAKLIDGDLAVSRHERFGHFCGYCAFRNDEIPTEWQGNYNAPGLQYLAIHGGLTFAKAVDGHTIFGFDCAHAGDDDNPKLQSAEYVMSLTRQMRDQLAAFRDRHTEWESGDRQSRADLLDDIRGQADLPTEYGFGALIDMLSGASELGEANS